MIETALVAAAAALLGAIVGGTLSGVLELWRQVVSGLAASKVIRTELMSNATVIDFILADDARIVADFHDNAWLQLRTAVAPLITDTDLGYLQATYSARPMYEGHAKALRSDSSNAYARKNIAGWRRQMKLAATNLQEMEATGRIKLLWRLLLPQRWRPTSFDEAERWSDQLAELERRRAEEESP